MRAAVCSKSTWAAREAAERAHAAPATESRRSGEPPAVPRARRAAGGRGVQRRRVGDPAAPQALDRVSRAQHGRALRADGVAAAHRALPRSLVSRRLGRQAQRAAQLLRRPHSPRNGARRDRASTFRSPTSTSITRAPTESSAARRTSWRCCASRRRARAGLRTRSGIRSRKGSG